MSVTSKEAYELMEQFERDYHHLRLDREKDKTLWARGNVYEDGETNKTFAIYSMGYSFGKAKGRAWKNNAIDYLHEYRPILAEKAEMWKGRAREEQYAVELESLDALISEAGE